MKNKNSAGMGTKIRMVVSDFDGTLHHPETGISPMDYQSLVRLGEMGIIRVIATGRNPVSFSRATRPDFPIDYLIFSSGTGITHWPSGTILTHWSLPADNARHITTLLRDGNYDFMVHKAVPDNHCFAYHGDPDRNEDFRRRCSLYSDFIVPLEDEIPYAEVSQILVVLPPDPEKFFVLRDVLEEVRVIRSTSPINGRSIWLEIFNQEVSKGHAAAWLCDHLGIRHEETLACGNDYNDIELLEWAGRSYLLENAPHDLKPAFSLAGSVENSGFTGLVNKYFIS